MSYIVIKTMCGTFTKTIIQLIPWQTNQRQKKHFDGEYEGDQEPYHVFGDKSHQATGTHIIQSIIISSFIWPKFPLS